ncbi:hypothetical protein [Streptomyces violascens]|uniref:hypothetical protein n=1 Tax=Streptomyces violascens TaxID=67381 RepID=UPI001CFC7642|nr:hypothetical protein [Streptomyces violascens]
MLIRDVAYCAVNGGGRMARDTAAAEAGMKGITFPAWHGKHYVTLAELLVRLGSFSLDLTWHVQFDEIVDPRCAEMERRSAGAGMDTLTLLSLTTPFLQLIDAEARGFAGNDLVLVLTEFDSSSWEVRAIHERVLSELRQHYPGAEDL